MKTKKSKLFKRALAAILTMTMALGVVPMTAFAEETSQAAQEAAAMRALESRVFTIADEQYTIADLEKATAVMVITEEGENITVPGNEIRSYLALNPVIKAIGGTATISMQINSQNWNYRFYIYINSDEPIESVQIGQLWCVNSGKQYGYVSDVSNKGYGSRTLGIYPGNWFAFPQGGTANVYWRDFHVDVGSMGGFEFDDGNTVVNAPG